MREGALQLELPDEAEHGIWPWLIAVLGGICLIVAARHVAISIPELLASQASAVFEAEGQSEVAVVAQGRDITLTGELTATADREALLRRITSIPGVRVVADSMTVDDPIADARSQRAAFGDALGALDLTTVSFEPGSDTFAAGSDRALTQLAQLLTAWPEYRIRVVGHTDNTGRPAVNLQLSRDRARAVADWLIARGAGESQIIAQGYGHTQPIADNATAEGRSRNRRIEVRYVD